MGGEFVVVCAQIGVSNTSFSHDKLYTYSVPVHLACLVRVGSMVLIPFGRGSKPRVGVVVTISTDITDLQGIRGVKAIHDVADENVTLTKELLELAFFLRERTFCTYYEAVKAIIPYGAQYKIAMQDGEPLLKKQILNTTVKAYKQGEPDTKKPNQNQTKVLDFLKDTTKRETEIVQECMVSKSVLSTMLKNKMLQVVSVEKEIDIYKNEIPEPEIILSAKQNEVFLKLCDLQNKGEPQVALLHGVTSSGKTLVFIKLLEQTLAKGKKAIVLVPEIGLTPQMVKRLKGVFGNRVAVQHSALSNTERLLQWKQIQQGEADIVVGTRSAVFAPVENIGLVIIDEEQEHTYHSDMSPRFLAHDIAKKRVVDNNALLLLASATPSVESYYQAKQGSYTLLEINERYGKATLPQVEIVDMRNNLLQGNTGFLSEILREEICYNLNNGEQTILLLNRRGYQTVAICDTCATVIKCQNCTVPMVYHKGQNKLLCHHCGSSVYPPPQKCVEPECQGYIKYTGYGTQKIEEDLAAEFPNARILRMDLDSTSHKNAHEEMLSKFGRGEYDIMIGTQMVAKGLDFAKVSLVGVVGIDSLLLNNSYKAFENVFSLVTQVVGRSGRSGLAKGRAIIQTLSKDHPVLNLASEQDYKAFYQDEILFREMNLYPPFCSICLICFNGTSEKDVVNAARYFSNLLSSETEKYNKTNKKTIPIRIIGPTAFGVLMVNSKYRYKLTVKCRNDKTFRGLLQDIQNEFLKQEHYQKVNMYFDFNQEADT